MLRPWTIAKAVLFACGWLSVLVAGTCHAQEAQAAGAQGTTPVFTLKVYTNLVQIPTLVLDHDRGPLPKIDFRRFQVSLDSGKLFAPTNVRMEGDDPLDIAIVLDVSGSQKELIGHFGAAAAEMASKSLHPRDHVTVYALACNMVRSAKGMPALPDLMGSAVQNVLASSALNKSTDDAKPCGKGVYLWGALAQVVKDLNDATGRRVILVISQGVDQGGAATWTDLHEFAATNGVAIFGMNSGEGPPAMSREVRDPLRALCESTGGIVMSVYGHDLNKPLQRWVAMLRGRYVLEFPRPQALGMGQHNIEVSIKRDGLAFVTLAGVSMTLPDPALTADPHYVPSQEGSDIPVGKRRPLR